MKKVVMMASIIAVASLTTGCATIFKGKTQKVNIATSNNEQISVNVDGKTVTAPSVVELTRKDSDLTVTTSAKGCTPNTSVESSVEPVFFVNILSGGPLGSTTDYATGSMWKYDSNIVVNCK